MRRCWSGGGVLHNRLGVLLHMQHAHEALLVLLHLQDLLQELHGHGDRLRALNGHWHHLHLHGPRRQQLRREDP